MTSSVLSVELVSVAYERMNDWPAHWSVLTRTPVMVTRVDGALERLLVERDGGDGARLQVDLALQADAGAERSVGRTAPIARGDARARVDLGLVGDDAAADLLAGLQRAAGQLGLAAAGDLAGERARDQVLARRDRGGQRCDRQLRLVGCRTTSRCQPSGVSRIPGGGRRDGTLRRQGRVASTGWTAGSGGGGGSASATGAVADRDARCRLLPAWQNGSTWCVSAPLVGRNPSGSNGSVATEHPMAGLPNGERTANNSRLVPIE